MTKHEIIRASALKRKDYLESADKSLLKNLEKRIDHLTENVDKSTKTNIELQEKIAELMMHLTELIENIQNMSKMVHSPNSISSKIKLPETSNEFEEEQHPGGELKEPVRKDMTAQLKELAIQNKELAKTLRGLETQLKKGAVRDAIKKALEKVKK